MYLLLSHIISEKTPSYGNRDRVYIKKNSSIQSGDSANTSSYFISNNHIGTHIDVPKHFSDKGLKTFEVAIEQYFFYKIGLIDCPCDTAKLIGISDVKSVINQIEPDIDLLLIKTGYEQYRGSNKYWDNNPGLAPELADYLRSNLPNLRCVGFDFISLTSWKFRQFGKESHLAFLCPSEHKQPILIIEDMSLIKLINNPKTVIVAPLFVEDGNGGAVTVIAEM